LADMDFKLAGLEDGIETWANERKVLDGQPPHHLPALSGREDDLAHPAATLVLEPIFEADLPSELYAYRPGRNAQQAVVEVEERLFRGRPEVVDADLADYFGSIPMPRF